jgi:hypothetical protein
LLNPASTRNIIVQAVLSEHFEALETPRGWTYYLDRNRRADALGWFWTPIYVTCVVLAVVTGTYGIPRADPFLGAFLEFPLQILRGVTIMIGGVTVAIYAYAVHELRIDRESLHVVTRLGPLICSHIRLRRSQVADLVVARTSLCSPHDDSKVFHVLFAENEQGVRRDLISRYPRETLLFLAEDVSKRWKVLGIDPELGDVAGKVAIRGETLIATEISERLHQPRGSKLRLEYLKNGDTRIVAPSGYDARFAIAMFMATTLIVLPFFGPVVLMHFRSIGAEGVQYLLCILTLVQMIFWVGVFWVIHNFKTASAGFMLVANREKLTRTIFRRKGMKTRTWQNSEIVCLRVVSQLKGDEETGTYYHHEIHMQTQETCVDR